MDGPEQSRDRAYLVVGSRLLSKGDDSPVYRYHQTLDPTTFGQTHASFADWLTEHIEAHVDKLRQLGQPY